MARLVEWGGRTPIPPLYKDGGGDGIPHSFIIHLLPLRLFFLPSAMARGGAGPSTVAARVAARQRVPPSQDLAAAEPATRGRGRGGGAGRRGARGRGGWGGASSLPPPVAPPPME